MKTGGIKQFWDSGVFDDWKRAKHPEYVEVEEAEKAYLNAYIKQGKTLLDVGCNNGSKLEWLAGRLSMGVGIDISERRIKTAKNLHLPHKNLRFCVMNAEKMGFPDNRFDYVTSMGHTAGNLMRPNVSLREMKRVLNSEGAIFWFVYSRDSIEFRLRAYRQLGLNIKSVTNTSISTMEGIISRHYTPSQLIGIGNKEGLSVKVEKLTEIYYVALMRK